MTLTNEEHFRRETARDVLCAILANSTTTTGVAVQAKKFNVDLNIILADMAIEQAEVLMTRLKLCRHKNIGKVLVENADGSKTCPDCGKNLK